MISTKYLLSKGLVRTVEPLKTEEVVKSVRADLEGKLRSLFIEYSEAKRRSINYTKEKILD